MFHKKISYFLVLTFCFLLFLPSCSNNVDTPEQSIQRVLTTIFTCPDNEAKEYGKILNKNKYSLEQENSQTEIAEAEKRMQEHLCQKTAFCPCQHSRNIFVRFAPAAGHFVRSGGTIRTKRCPHTAT